MNRRSFFKSLSLAAPLFFLPKFEPVHWKVWHRRLPNPAWVRAPFEMRFVDLPMLCDDQILAEAGAIIPVRGFSRDYVVYQKGSMEPYGLLHERMRTESVYTLETPPQRFEYDSVRKELVEVEPFL